MKSPAKNREVKEKSKAAINRQPAKVPDLVKKLDGASVQALFSHGQELLADFSEASNDRKSYYRRSLLDFLDNARSSLVLGKIADENKQDAWFNLLLVIMKKTNFTTGELFQQRARQYRDKALFREIRSRGFEDHSWREVNKRVGAIARSLFALAPAKGVPGPVAIWSHNSFEMALVDLACLCHGIVNVLIPANAVISQVEYILEQSKPRMLFASNTEQVTSLLGGKKPFKSLQRIIHLSKAGPSNDEGPIPFEDFVELGKNVPWDRVEHAAKKVKLKDLATVMYTSGTTQAPKGIMFSHLNIVSKRFARAIALPQVGDSEVFLCYLPLYHTFGRWLEMMGCVFWGSTYVFMQNPSIGTMIDNMRRVQPTVFISIPKKWIQLHEKIGERVDIHEAKPSEIRRAVEHCTGGKLRWGLSAAGFLDPEMFRFFQENGVELMSGFGMTEAAGGITMTPPNNYQEHTVGTALAGIEIRLAEDGEMLIKGPYVMKGYIDSTSTDLKNGWFATGDIFSKDEHGYYRIVDRKKEIYKNVKGETIAPQKIENLFKDFESIQRVYLVGDHQEYNTLLIYPNYEYEQTDLKKLGREKLRDFFNSIVVSVNRFLAPYESIVDFAIIDRDFSLEKGELTPKGSFKRNLVDGNFRDQIQAMYEKGFARYEISGIEVRIPNWFLRSKGLTADDFGLHKSAIVLKATGVKLRVRLSPKDPTEVVVGNCTYRVPEPEIDLGQLIDDPELWLGNQELQDFVGAQFFRRARVRVKRSASLKMIAPRKTARPEKQIVANFEQTLQMHEKSLTSVHLAAYLLQSSKADLALEAIQHLESLLKPEESILAQVSRAVLKRAHEYEDSTIIKRAFKALILSETGESFRSTFEQFVGANPGIVDEEIIALICDSGLEANQVQTMISLLAQYADSESSVRSKTGKKAVSSLIQLLTYYGEMHPAWYKSIRSELYKWTIFPRDKSLRAQASQAIRKLQTGFRQWLGSNQLIAVDPESAKEYKWADVVTFEESIDHKDKRLIFECIKNVPLIREAIFLFTESTLIGLQDISPSGIWISFLGARHGKIVYRVSVQTRHYGAFDLAVNINRSLSEKQVLDEINWLICAGTTEGRVKLVEDFGGYWPEFGLWTEEFVAGETVSKYLRRLDRRQGKEWIERMQLLWPYLVWNGLSAYIDFWCRTGRKLVISDPTPDNVIVPPHDYHVGSRIVSISERKRFKNILEMILSFQQHFIGAVEQTYDKLEGRCSWNVVLSAFLEVLGEHEGLQIFESAVGTLLSRDLSEELSDLREKIDAYISSVRSKGFQPQRLHFAIRRFRRWLQLNPKATPQAQMQTLQDLYQTYFLDLLEKEHPGTRIQYFRDTVFAQADKRVVQALDRLLEDARTNQLKMEQMLDRVSQPSEQPTFSEDEQFFLARMTYPHLQPSDTAELISLTAEGTKKTDLLVFMEDVEGTPFSIRHPASPKEIARLHRLFELANLPVEFRPQHHFLVALDERQQVRGGLFYIHLDNKTVHMEKIVVAKRHRKKGISEGLLHEFFNRLRSQGIEIVTVGFLRREFFYKFGFKIDHRYGNMVKKLEARIPSEPVEPMPDNI